MSLVGPSGSGVPSVPPSARVAHATGSGIGPDDWSSFEHDAQRTGYAANESSLTPAEVPNLTLLWNFTPGGPVEGSSIVVDGTVYFGSWDGYEYALNATTGALVWKHHFEAVVDPGCPWISPHGITSTATYVNGTLYVSDGGSTLSALASSNGTVLWQRQLGMNESVGGGVYLWASPLVYHGYVYEGIASGCDNPLIQGALVQVYASNGTIDHTFDVVSSGNVGGSIWATPSVDPTTNVVWVDTGNEGTSYEYSLSVIALNATTLQVEGYNQLNGVGYDFDFGAGPTLFSDSHGTSMVGAMNKDGYFYAYNRSNVSSVGWNPVWVDRTTNFTPFTHPIANAISPAAFDGRTLFTGGGNTSVGGVDVLGSVWALSPGNGSEVWHTAMPGVVRAGLAAGGGVVAAAVSGQVYSNSFGRYFDTNSSELAVLSAATGRVLFNYSIPFDMNSAPVIAEGKIFVGAGSANLTAWNEFPRATGGFYAFGLTGSGQPRVVASAHPVSGDAPLPVHFSAAGQGGSPPYTYAWDFDDGSNSSAADVNHTYSTPGNYTASLVLTDQSDGHAYASFAIDVLPGPPPPNLTVRLDAAPASGTAPLLVNLTAAVNGTGSSFSYLWDFGEGPKLSLGPNVSHTYRTAGTFVARVDVANGIGQSANASFAVRVFAPFLLQVGAAPAQGPLPLVVRFFGNASGGSGGDQDVWSFGDGSFAFTANANHTYVRAGVFTANLTVSDSIGQEVNASISVVVLPSALTATVGYRLLGVPSCSAGTTPTQLNASAHGGAPPFTFAWQGAGIPAGATGSVVNVSLPLGANSVTVEVTDSTGTSNSTTRDLPSFSPPTPCTSGGTITTDELLIVAVGVGLAGAIVGWFWGRRRGKPAR